MSWMFSWANSFNQPIGDWDVKAVTDMSWMFALANSFNQPIGDWDVKSVTNMYYMFSLACSMEGSNLPSVWKPEDVNLDYCLSCMNCPANGGECLNGFKRSDSYLCNICPLGDTKINASCMACPSNPFFSFLLPFATLASITVISIVFYFLRKRGWIRLPNMKFDLKNMIRAKQVGAALQILQVFAEISVSITAWFKVVANFSARISVPVDIEPRLRKLVRRYYPR